MDSSCGHDDKELKDHSSCHHSLTNPSLHQTLDELDFDRGIWNAALYGDLPDVMKKLTESRCDVNSCDRSGYTALHYACRSGHFDVCKVLVEHGACVNAATSSTKATPLHRAAYMGHDKIVSLLLDHNADTTAQDCDGKTPWNKAQEKGNETTSQILINSQTSK